MRNEPLEPIKTSIYVADEQTPADIGDVIKLEHSDGIYFGEVIAIETGDAGEALIFRYIKPKSEFDSAPIFKINRPFSN